MKYASCSTNAVFRFNANFPEKQPVPDGFESLIIEEQHLPIFFGSDPNDAWRLKEYKRLLKLGCLGFLLHEADQWVAVQWIAVPGSVGPPHLPPSIVKDHYWCFNEHTRKQYRRRGLWSALKKVSIQHARDLSNNQTFEIFSDTPLANLASKLAHESFGFDPVGLVQVINIRVPKVHTFQYGRWLSSNPQDDP